MSKDKTKSGKDINVENNKDNNATKQKKDLSETKVYQKVDEMPSFPGGDESLMKFFNENIRYPQSAKESGINGKVFITFIIDENGKVTEVKVLRGIGGGCDEEAVRVARLMPQWNPGKQNGKAVRVEYNMPIKFQL